MLGVAALGAQAAEPAASAGFSAGLTVQGTATAGDIGLAIYPGAKPVRDRDDDSPGANLNLWGGSFGMRLQALKLHTPDSVDAVARFYRDSMARYGRVLDCGNAPEATPDATPGAARDERTLRCDKERPKPGQRVFKVGTEKQMRMVSIEPAASGGAQVQLLRLEIKSD